MVHPDSNKLCVIGSEMAGKTTFVNSFLQVNQPPPKEKDRTPGVVVHNSQITKVGKNVGFWCTTDIPQRPWSLLSKFQYNIQSYSK